MTDVKKTIRVSQEIDDMVKALLRQRPELHTERQVVESCLLYTSKIEQQKNPLLRDILLQKSAELEWISQNRKEREFAICFYSRNLDDYRKNYLQIYSQLTSAAAPLCRKLSGEKKKQIIYNLYNKNCAI